MASQAWMGSYVRRSTAHVKCWGGAGQSFVILGSLLLMLSAPVALITRRAARKEAEPTLAD